MSPTDNGACYKSRISPSCYRDFCLHHSCTRRYRPRTDRKAERFIQTVLREWDYAFAFYSSAWRS